MCIEDIDRESFKTIYVKKPGEGVFHIQQYPMQAAWDRR